MHLVIPLFRQKYIMWFIYILFLIYPIILAQDGAERSVSITHVHNYCGGMLGEAETGTKPSQGGKPGPKGDMV